MSCRVSEMLIFFTFEKNFKKCFATALKQPPKKQHLTWNKMRMAIFGVSRLAKQALI